MTKKTFARVTLLLIAIGAIVFMCLQTATPQNGILWIQPHESVPVIWIGLACIAMTAIIIAVVVTLVGLVSWAMDD